MIKITIEEIIVVWHVLNAILAVWIYFRYLMRKSNYRLHIGPPKRAAKKYVSGTFETRRYPLYWAP